MIKFIALINLCLWSQYIFINEELIILISLIIVYVFLIRTLKKFISYMFFFQFDNIYILFNVLFQLNFWMYWVIILNIFHELWLYYIRIDFTIMSVINIEYLEKINNDNIKYFFNIIKSFFSFILVIKNLFNFLLLNLNSFLKQLFKKLNNLFYIFNLVLLKNKKIKNKLIFLC